MLSTMKSEPVVEHCKVRTSLLQLPHGLWTQSVRTGGLSGCGMRQRLQMIWEPLCYSGFHPTAVCSGQSMSDSLWLQPPLPWMASEAQRLRRWSLSSGTPAMVEEYALPVHAHSLQVSPDW